MRKIHILTILCFCTILLSCTKSIDTEKHQNKRHNIIDVKERVKEIEEMYMEVTGIAEGHFDDMIQFGYLPLNDNLINQ